MNFLAHALLAGETPALIVGGVVGDWVKGGLPGALPADLAQGVALHRAIDVFAETHPAFCASRARMSLARRRYAGVLVDIFYDHLLARDWSQHHPQALGHYCARIHQYLDHRLDDLPERARPALEWMAREHWLERYADIDAIGEVLERMSQRVRRPNPLAGGELELRAEITAFEADFRAWLADARVFVALWRRHNLGQHGEPNTSG